MYCRSILVLFAIGLMSGCGEGDMQMPETTAAVFNPAGAPTVEFSAPDMMCLKGCGAKVKEILAGQPGVKDVLVDFETKTATVAIKEGKFDSAAAVAALVDHGFDHSTLKNEAATTTTIAQP